jgi:hypothetical protein
MITQREKGVKWASGPVDFDFHAELHYTERVSDRARERIQQQGRRRKSLERWEKVVQRSIKADVFAEVIRWALDVEKGRFDGA